MKLYTQSIDKKNKKDCLDGLFVDLDDQMCISLELPGGGGFGNPKDRDPSAIEEDLKDEILSSKDAEDQYFLKRKKN